MVQSKQDSRMGRGPLGLEKLMQPGSDFRNPNQAGGNYSSAASAGGRENVFVTQNRPPAPQDGQQQHQHPHQQLPFGVDLGLKSASNQGGQVDPSPAMQSHIPSVHDLLQTSGRHGVSESAGLPNIQSFSGQGVSESRPGSSQAGGGYGAAGNGHSPSGDFRGSGQQHGGMNMFSTAQGGMGPGEVSGGANVDDPARVQLEPRPLEEGADIGGAAESDQHMVHNLFGVGGEGGNNSGLGGNGGGFGF